MIPNKYLEKVYAGFIGMNIGIRLGAPVEPTAWTSERIERFYGDITDYVKPFKNFAADDDVNGPVYFLRALKDHGIDRPLTPEAVADAWLNYTREGVGMFWWGGYGVSTEHTAYLNLKNGIKAPASGSAEVNGLIMSEQIGGQIFIDTWGLVFPGRPHMAAKYASIAASVSHDFNGIYGAAFLAACIAKAFETTDVEEIVEAGLKEIPEDSTYAKVVRAVMDFHHENPNDFRACLRYLQENWGYDKYTGVCHIIPNAGVCVLSMVYGKTFNRTVEIATMCGWDTDCNAGNVGTIMGVAHGIVGLGWQYRAPINDSVVLSGISGYLNILDIPTYSKEIALIGYALSGENPPLDLVESYHEGEIYFDFELPGSTHNFRASNPSYCRIKHSTDMAYSGSGSLQVMFDRLSRGQRSKIYYKPFYRRDDFDDERYMPVFSPTVYAGQEVSMMVNLEQFGGESIIINPYVRNTRTKEEILIGGYVLKGESWREIKFTVPETDGAMIDEVGLLFEANSPAKNKDFGCLYIDNVKISGNAHYTIDISKQSAEFASITPFSHNHGAWSIENGVMEAMCLSHAEATTGNYFMKNVEVKGRITPHTGKSHLISLRVAGAQRGYYAGIHNDGIAILKHDETLQVLVSVDYDWSHEETYEMVFTAQDNQLKLSVNGEEKLKCNDESLSYGMVGYAMYELGRSGFGNLVVKVLD